MCFQFFFVGSFLSVWLSDFLSIGGSWLFLVILPENMFELATSFSFSHDFFLSLASYEENLFLGSLSLIKWKSLFFGASILAMILTSSSMVSSSSFSIPFSSFQKVTSFKMGELRRSSAEGLTSGLTLRQSEMKSFNSLEQPLGKGLKLPFMMACLSPFKSVALKGGLDVAISQSTHPNDQMSHLQVQGLSFQTSGLAQQGVPAWVFAMPLSLILETFMSASLKTVCSLLMRMFADLMSLWKMLILCRLFSPFRHWIATFQILDSLISFLTDLYFLMYWLKSPPSKNSVTRQKELEISSQNESMQATTQGLSMEARILTSLRQLAIYFSERDWILILLRAYSLESAFLLTLQTEAKAPSPSLEMISYWFMDFCKEQEKFLKQIR